MRIATRRAIAFVAVGMLALTACAEAPDEEPDVIDEPEEIEEPEEVEAVDFRGCLVTDAGGVDDRSFNETAHNGLVMAGNELGIETAVLESTDETDYEPNVQAFIDQDCDIIITVGFLLGDVTEQAAIANPDQLFTIVDYAYDETYDNLLGLVFATEEAAFLAGYVAAAMSESGILGTYGGIPIPPVTVFMDGYLAGASYYNEEHGTDVTVLGWDGSDGLFTGDFDTVAEGRNVSDALLQDGADVILPVAGPVGEGTATAIEDFDDGLMIWVDTDGVVLLPQYRDIMLTSVMKNMDIAVFDAVMAAYEGTFEGGVYVGTLENEGVGIAPFYEFEDEVPQEVKDRLAELEAGIIAGEISVDPADYGF